MSVLSTELTNRIRHIRLFQQASQQGMLKHIIKLTTSKYPEDSAFLKAFNRALAFHVTGDHSFSEKTINELYTVVNEYYLVKGISPLLQRLIKRLKPFCDEAYAQMERAIELEKMQRSFNPLKLHSTHLQKQLRHLIKENVALIELNEQYINSAKKQKKINASLEMKLKTLEQEAKILRAQNGCFNRLLGAFKSYLGLTITALSPSLYEKVKQLYLFKDDPRSFDEVSKSIESELHDLLDNLKAETVKPPVLVKMEASEDTDMTEAQQLLLTNLKKVWDEINSEAQREKAFCAIVETIKRMYEPARKTFNLCLLQKMSPTLKHRYCVLKEGLYKELQKAEYNSKPFFSTKDAVGVIDSSLIGSAEKYVSTYEQEHPAEKPNMIVLLDNFFEIIQQILVYRHAEPECKEVATVTPLPTLAPAAAAPAA